MPKDSIKEDALPMRSTNQQLAAFDIREYIKRLPEPERTMCFSVIVEGRKTKEAAESLGVHPKTVLRHVRRALAPLAKTYGITAADKFIRDEKAQSARRTAKSGRKGGK